VLSYLNIPSQASWTDCSTRKKKNPSEKFFFFSIVVAANLLGDWVTNIADDVATLLSVPNYRYKKKISKNFCEKKLIFERVLIYSGTEDLICNYYGGEKKCAIKKNFSKNFFLKRRELDSCFELAWSTII
jgi:hypothetical protein